MKPVQSEGVHRQDGSWKLPEAAIPEQLISKAPKLSWIKPLQICSLLAVALRTKKVAGGRHPAKSKKCRGRFHQNHSESTNMSSLGRENAIHNRITVIYLTKPNKKHCKTHDFNVTLGCKSTCRMYDMNRHTQHLPQAKFFEGCMPAASTRLSRSLGKKKLWICILLQSAFLQFLSKLFPPWCGRLLWLETATIANQHVGCCHRPRQGSSSSCCWWGSGFGCGCGGYVFAFILASGWRLEKV